MSNAGSYHLDQETVQISPQQYSDLNAYNTTGVHRLAKMAPVVYAGDYPVDPQLRANTRPLPVLAQAPVVVPSYGGNGRLHHWLRLANSQSGDYHPMSSAYGYFSRY